MSRQQTKHLQHWLKDVIVSPGDLEQKLSFAQHRHNLTEHQVISREGKASVEARLSVYTTGYILRLTECLAADFPLLKKFIGDEVFYVFAQSAIAHLPSSSYTLSELGNSLIRFLELSKPGTATEDQAGLFDLPIELAKLERTIQEVIRASGTENTETPFNISFEAMIFQADQISITVPGCLRLVKTKFPMKTFFRGLKGTSWEHDELPLPAPAFMAISRKNYRVTMDEIPEWQYEFLQACKQGTGLLAAVHESAHLSGRSKDEILGEIYLWLPNFVASGFITCN
ncbi:MAG TPA: putative DNA-binding domain-containing protein [Pedobacter sp.]